MVGEWRAIKRLGNKGPISGSIIFRDNGTCETIRLPWGILTGNEAQLSAFESINGRWDIRPQSGKQVVWVEFEKAASTGRNLMTALEPRKKNGQWTFRQYIGDPDLMDIVEFKRVSDVPSR